MNLRTHSSLNKLMLILVLLIGLAIVFSLATDAAFLDAIPKQYYRVIKCGLAIVWFGIGVKLIQTLHRIINGLSVKNAPNDISVKMFINRVVSAIGYVFVLLVALHLLHVKISSILVGGAVTGVIVGIAAQSTLSNLFAGLILFTLRPFSIGEFITLRTYLFGGIEYSGTVLDVNWYHTVLLDGQTRRLLPNSSIIVSAITVGSESDAKLFMVPLPYSISFHDFEARLLRITDSQASLSVKGFSEQTYMVQVQFPASADLDLVRETIADLRTQESAFSQLETP